MKTSNNNADGLDLISPIVEIVGGMLKMFFKFTSKIGEMAYRKYLGLDPIVEKIEYKHLTRRNNTTNEEALGVDLKSKKDLLLKDIDTSKHTFIVGASGFGKTNLISILQENSLKKGVPIIFFDPKGGVPRRICQRVAA